MWKVTAANDKEDTKMSLRMGGGHKRAAASETEGDREIVKVREGGKEGEPRHQGRGGKQETGEISLNWPSSSVG